MSPDDQREWLEPDGLGGFASGTVAGFRTRRYHALLLAAARPPADRFVLVNGMEVWVDAGSDSFAISCQRYAGGGVYPNPSALLQSFSTQPCPTWVFDLPGFGRLTQEIMVVAGQPLVLARWRTTARRSGRVRVRPLLSGRDYHQLHHENTDFRFAADCEGQAISWQPYSSVLRIYALATGIYRHEPEWYRNFWYREEAARGLDCIEDLASPGIFELALEAEPAALAFSAKPFRAVDAAGLLELAAAEQQQRTKPVLEAAADAYLVVGQTGPTILAGYPWFTDWGRDTMISLRGLCLARGKIDLAVEMLNRWAKTVSQGMLPNYFPDRGEVPAYNSVDAALWFILLVREIEETAPENRSLSALRAAGLNIIDHYMAGTRYGIRMTTDGLLRAGVPGVQLTWMDARVGNQVITPRIGKPVEVEALWINALRAASNWNSALASVFARAVVSFQEKFWNGTFLYDVIEVDHDPTRSDPSFRPNQIFAAGGLPFTLVGPDQAAQIVQTVRERLLTPAGLRSLAPDDTHYHGHYRGGVPERDGAYHQGTVWPWLMGAFLDAWLKWGRPGSEKEAFELFVDPLIQRLDRYGLNHLFEIADGDEPYNPRGCPFQAWSVGELVRILRTHFTSFSATAALLRPQ